MSGSLVTQPLRLGARGAALVIRETLSVSQRVLRLLGLAGAPAERASNPPQRVAGPAERAGRPAEPAGGPAGPGTRNDAGTATASAVPGDPPPAPVAIPPVAIPPVATEPAHVSESLELVAEVAEPGAEDGAGAQVRIAEPWDGYRGMAAADIIGHLASASREELATVELYELAGRRRKSVVAAAQRALKQASPPR